MTFLYVSSVALTAVPISSFAETSQDIESKNKEISALKSKKSDVSQQITTLESEIQEIYDKGIELNQKKTSLANSSKQLEKEITDLNTRIEKRTEAIQNQGRNVQVNGQSSKMLDILLNAESVSDAVGRIQAISNIMSANNDLIKQQQEDKDAVVEKQADIKDNLKSIDEANEQLGTERDNLVAKQADLNVLKGDIDSQTATAENAKSALMKQQQDALKAQQEQAAKEKQAKEAATQASTSKQAETATSSSSEATTTNSTQSSASESSTSGGGTASSDDTNKQLIGEPSKPDNGDNNPPKIVESNSADATFQELNKLRVAHGLNPVSWNDGLAASAAGRAAGMQDYNIPSDHWRRGDEVIAFMFAPGNSVIMAWYNETNMQTSSGTGHRDWELNPNMTSVGFGYVGDVIVGHSA